MLCHSGHPLAIQRIFLCSLLVIQCFAKPFISSVYVFVFCFYFCLTCLTYLSRLCERRAFPIARVMYLRLHHISNHLQLTALGSWFLFYVLCSVTGGCGSSRPLGAVMLSWSDNLTRVCFMFWSNDYAVCLHSPYVCPTCY